MSVLSAIQSAAQVVGGRLISGLAAGLLLAALTAVVIRAFRTSSTRFAVCFLTLVAVAFLPIASCFVSGHVTGVQSAEGIAIPSRWALALFGLWMVGAGIGLIRIAAGLWRVHRIRRRSVELAESVASGSAARALLKSDPTLNLNLAETANRPVALCISDDVSVPTALGFFRPAILLPSWAMRELSADELNSILLHELGHLRRRDDWTNLAQKILQALLFFHPAVWWIDSRLALEREAACDDLVVAKTCDARGYAKCLVSVAEKSVGRRPFAVAVAAVSRIRETTARLTRILDQNRPAGTQVCKPVLATFATLTLAFLIEMPRMPAIVVFSDAAPATIAQNHPAVANVAQSIAAIVSTSAQIETSMGEGLLHPALRKAELRTRGARGSRNAALINSALTKSVLTNDIETNAKLKPSLRLARANWNQEQMTANQAAIVPTLLLVMQTVICDEYGNCFVSVRSWQVLTVQQTLNQAQNGNGSKSI
ncbi:MAG: hypothetical protein DMG62_12960 [Acidobacteria bacterium]|nr:MAG: hypothetical protein DMG63_00960 [Acidobacteriota bacterium]PYY22512.1 MAG: hypothetical protein DMG62_12960 [Acidobacteriota bacterium]